MTDKLIDAVREDIRCHRDNGVSLNPYSTNMSRWSWQAGFEGKPMELVHYPIPYQRGQLAAQLTKEQS
jgi:hypothetical protein